MRHRLSRAAIWRTGWLLAAAALVIVAQQLGWSRVGHALAVVAGPVGGAVWRALKLGWPAMLAVVMSLLLGMRSRERLLGVAASVRHGMAGRRWLAIVGLVVGVAGLLVVVLVTAPPWFVHDRSLEGLKAQNEIRTTLLQGVGGVVLLVGAYFTYRQLRTTREGRITERYTRAIDQLGHVQLDVRLGGIYALERIARDSPADRATIGEVLTAFVRGHAPWPPRLPGQYVATAPINQVPLLQEWAADVQASLTVLGRGGFAPPTSERDRLDLSRVDLRRASLAGAYLEGADLADAHLEWAFLFAVHLEGAILRRAHLEDASLRRAHLEGATLRDAHLERADLRGIHQEGADLGNAHLERAGLDGAHLEGADLSDMHLEGVDLDHAHLERARLVHANLEGARLDDAHLEGADLGGAHLEGATLRDAHLEGTNLFGAHLEGASLRDAHLERAYFRDTRLERANLSGARLEGANLSGARLEGANLDHAHLERTYLIHAHLEGANLSGAHLEGAHLERARLGGAHLEEALADEDTSWPSGFDWHAAGVIVVGEDAAESPPQPA